MSSIVTGFSIAFHAGPLRRRLATGVVSLVLFLLSAAATPAAVRVWDGSASFFWTNAANWVGGAAPVSGDGLVFPAGAARTLTTNTPGAAASFSFLRLTGDGYVLAGPPLTLGAGITNTPLVGSVNTIASVVQPRFRQTWSVGGKTQLLLSSNVVFPNTPIQLGIEVASGGQLVAGGGVLGDATVDLRKTGSGVLTLGGRTNLIGDLVVEEGSLNLLGELQASLVISNGASLLGTGVVTSVVCAGDLRPGGALPGILTVRNAGSPAFLPGARVVLDIHGTKPGIDHDQIRVPSAVSLAGADLVLLRSQSFAFQPGQRFVVITNQSTSTKFNIPFDNAPSNGLLTNNGVVFRISYAGGKGNDVELTVVDVPFVVTGVTHVWDGGGATDRSWGTALNWESNSLPGVGDDLVFPASVPGSLRDVTNSFTVALSKFNRLWFGGQGQPWTVRGGALQLSGGLVGTNALPLGEVAIRCAALGLLDSQSWRGTNLILTLGAPLLLNAHELSADLEAGTSLGLEREILGPGTLRLRSGEVQMLSSGPVSNVAVRIEGARLDPGQVEATGPSWQLTAGQMGGGFATIPGLQATGGILGSTANSRLTVAGPLELGPGVIVQAAFTAADSVPFLAAGPVILGDASLQAGPRDASLIGQPLVLIRCSGPDPVQGTFASLPEGATVVFTPPGGGAPQFSRISYVGGDGNDITLTPLAPAPSGRSLVWGGAGSGPLWSDAANWEGGVVPSLGDALIFPPGAVSFVSSNDLRSVSTHTLTWTGSNHLHSGGLNLSGGVSDLTAAGTNAWALSGGTVSLLGEQSWNVSNAAAVLRIFGTPAPPPSVPTLAAGNPADAVIAGVGPLHKLGEGNLELVDLALQLRGAVVCESGDLRLRNVTVVKTSGLRVEGGRLELIGVTASSLGATGGELRVGFGETLEGGGGGVTLFGDLDLSPAVELVVDVLPGAPFALRSSALRLNGARLRLNAAAPLGNIRGILVASYAAGLRTGEFAGLPENASLNIGAREFRIHYDLPDADETGPRQTILLEPVLVAPRFLSVERLADGSVRLRGVATPEVTVSILAAAQLKGFKLIGAAQTDASGLFEFTEPTPAAEVRFYRAGL